MQRFTSISILTLALFFMGCASNPLGSKVKEPFSGSKYESNQRFYRASAKGISKMDQVAQSQAEMKARQSIAQQVSTTFEVVTDNYQKNMEGSYMEEAVTRFETLAREITRTNLTDLRLVGNEKYLSDDGTYSVFVAFEIKKSSMYRHMKKQAKLDANISEQALKEIEQMLDIQIKAAESGED